MQLYLVRHGESIGNTKKGFISGRSDPDGLSRKGRIQIIRTAWELKDIPIDRFYVSPVHRAQETASILNLYHNAPLEETDWLTELHHGVFEGHFWWEVMDQVPSSWRKHREDYATAYPGGGESMKEVLHRVWDGYQSLLSNYKEESTVVLVSHQAVLTALLYCFYYGSPELITTAAEQKKFLEFMHTTVPANGSIINVALEDKKIQSITLEKNFKPLETTDDTVTFYMQGLLSSSQKPEIIPIYTSSGNTVYKLKVADDRYILKIYKDHELLSIQRLVKLYTYLEKETAIKAPLILHYEKNHIFFHEATVLQDYKSGNEQGDCFETCEENIDLILNQTLDNVLKIHAIPVEDVKEFWMTDDWEHKSHPTFQEYFKKEIRLTMDKIQQLPDISTELKVAIKNNLQKLHAYIKDGAYSIVPLHGDLSPHNFVTHHEEGTCSVIRVLDFERARLGDRVWDFVYYLGWLERSNAHIAEKWKQRMWSQFTDKEKEVFPFYWTLFHAWTIRDMMDYAGNNVRQRRGVESLELLKKLQS